MVSQVRSAEYAIQIRKILSCSSLYQLTLTVLKCEINQEKKYEVAFHFIDIAVNTALYETYPK